MQGTNPNGTLEIQLETFPQAVAAKDAPSPRRRKVDNADSVPSDAVQRATAIAPTSKEVFLGAQCLYLCLMVVFEGAADSIGHT